MKTTHVQFIGSAAALSEALGRVRRAAARILRSLRHRREVRELLKFDDRMLADIGISRLDLHRALDTPPLDDPSRLLADIQREARFASSFRSAKGKGRFRDLSGRFSGRP